MDEVESEALVAPEPASAPAAVTDFNEAAVDVDGEKYREVIERRNGSNKSRLGDINTEGRPRSCSFTSASSFSPTISTDAATGAPEIPFSIEQPPPMDILEEQLLTMSYTSSPKGANDNRPPSTPTTRYRQDGPRYRTSMMTCPFPCFPARADTDWLGRMQNKSQFVFLASCGNLHPSTPF